MQPGSLTSYRIFSSSHPPHPHPQPLAHTYPLSVSLGLPVLDTLYKGSHTVYGFSCLAPSLSVTFSRFIHVVSASFLHCFQSTQLHLTVCNPIDCSMPGFPVLHHLPEFAQTLVHWVSDAIQSSHPLLSFSPALNLSQLHFHVCLVNISLYGNTIICWSIHPCMDVYVASTFWLLHIEWYIFKLNLKKSLNLTALKL